MDVLRYHQTKPQPSAPPSSTLNPNAPIFIPMASYPTVDDFSHEWWDLVGSSPWFRDYWLHDCFLDPDHGVDDGDDDLDLLLPDFDEFFDHYLQKQEKEVEEEERRRERDLISMGALKWNKSSGRVEAPRYFEKAPKIVKSVRVNPRTIHQPR